MLRHALSLRKALRVVVAVCLAVQLGAVAIYYPERLGASAVVAVLSGALSLLVVRWAFSGLAAASARLFEMARSQDWQRSLRAPALIASGAHKELETLRQRLLERVERSQQLRRQAEEAAEYKAAFLRSVRHELRTPLNSILGFAEVLLSDLEGPLSPGQRENLQVIRSEGQRLSNLFDEVIELSTVLSDQAVFERSEVEPGRLLEAATLLQQEALADRVVHLRRDVAPGTPAVLGDFERLRGVLGGLLGYALRSTSGHELSLTAGAARQGVRIELGDPSRVLSPHDLSLLLDDKAITRRRAGLDEGARLRVSLCRQIVERQGGSFELTSDSERGTRFSITLPRASHG